jgi:hypothetical protein
MNGINDLFTMRLIRLLLKAKSGEIAIYEILTLHYFLTCYSSVTASYNARRAEEGINELIDYDLFIVRLIGIRP